MKGTALTMKEHRGESSWGYQLCGVAQSLQVNHRKSKTLPVVIFTFLECVIGIDTWSLAPTVEKVAGTETIIPRSLEVK